MAFASRIEGKVERPAPVSFMLNGRPVSGIPGESLAAALLVAGIRDLRSSVLLGARRGVFCMMGVCQECLVRVDGRSVAACLEPVRTGMVVELIANQGSTHE